MGHHLRIGTRGSQLALWQANHVKSLINRIDPDIQVSLSVIRTKGDRVTDRPLALIGGKGLFVKEIESALLAKEIDLAVHSMKDMPGVLPPGLTIGAIPRRGNPFDVLISRNGLPWRRYPSGSRVGTSSLRRASQLKHRRPDLEMVSIRGNLNTRMEKLMDGQYDAIVLAAAGLERLDQADRITEYLDDTIMVPAVGQGALCVESRESDRDLSSVLTAIDHADTRLCVTGERAFLTKIEGSCHIPVACFGHMAGDQVTLTAVVASLDGETCIRKQVTTPRDRIREAGEQLANTLLSSGGRQILDRIHSAPGTETIP